MELNGPRDLLLEPGDDGAGENLSRLGMAMETVWERGLLNMLAINYDYSGSGRVMDPLDRSIIVLEGIAWLP